MDQRPILAAAAGACLSLPLLAQDHAMAGMFGPYSMAREASGTSWQPESAPMPGIHAMHGEWMSMWHGFVNAVHDRQGGRRGERKDFAASMLAVMARRPAADGTLGLRGMFSLDPLSMGRGGYPLLFQTGETADGETPLIDRQHPHDFFMELAASYSRPLGDGRSAFVYLGLPGEPALGPSAYLHRASGMDNPEAPITHHWLDATHISFGVVTLGYVHGGIKLEASAFNGREPDQKRWNIETRRLDSAAARLTWNPTPDWSLQVSHGRLDSPEQLEPGIALRRTTASASHAREFGGKRWHTTLAWGRNRKEPGADTDGWLLESALQLGGRNTLFGRIERVAKDELFREGEALHGRTFRVGKLSLGAVHTFARVGHAGFAVGGLVSRYSVPSGLAGVYGSEPTSYMVFLRARLE